MDPNLFISVRKKPITVSNYLQWNNISALDTLSQGSWDKSTSSISNMKLDKVRKQEQLKALQVLPEVHDRHQFHLALFL